MSRQSTDTPVDRSPTPTSGDTQEGEIVNHLRSAADPIGHADDGLTRTLRALTSGTTHLVGLLDPDATVAYVSPSVTRIMGYAQDEVVGVSILSFIHPEDVEMALSVLVMASSIETPDALDRDDIDVAGEFRLRHADGHWITFEFLFNNFLTDPAIGGFLGIGRQVTARRALDDAFAALAHDGESGEALTKLVQYLDVRVDGTTSAFFIPGSEVEWITDQVPDALLANHGPWQAALDSGQSVVDDLTHTGIDHAADQLRQEARRSGMRSCWCVPVPLQQTTVFPAMHQSSDSGQSLGCLIMWSNNEPVPLEGHIGVIERVAGLAELALRRRVAARKLEHQATYDPVTGVLSRAGFETLFADGDGSSAILIVIDLDDFKVVNDCHGHPIGDQVLWVAAERILSVMRPGDRLGRLGGDEFVLRLAGGELHVATEVADRIIEVMQKPIVTGDLSIDARVSLGIAPFTPGATLRGQISQADAAMYMAKRGGKGKWQVWAPD